MRDNRRFQHGRSTFICEICDRNTRHTGQGVDHLCHECYDICGWDNTVNDSGEGIDKHPKLLIECERLLANAVKKGSNGQKIKDANRFIWPKG